MPIFRAASSKCNLQTLLRSSFDELRQGRGFFGSAVDRDLRRRHELDSVIPAEKSTNDRMNRLAGLVLRSITSGFLLVAPEQCLAQTQLVPAKVAVPALFRSSPFDRDRYLLVPRGFQIQVVS